MTIKEYISNKFQSFGIQVSEADLLDISFSVNVILDDDINFDNLENVIVALVQYVPFLMSRPPSVSESGFSMSWDKDALLNFYNAMCKRYGLRNELDANSPKIRFL